MGDRDGESEADRLLRMAVDALAAEFGHDGMMQEEQPDRIDLAYRAAVAYLGSCQPSSAP